MKNKTTLLFFILLLTSKAYSNTCTTTAGTYASWLALVWTCTSAPTGGPPGCGDVMNIGSGTTVNISADVDYSACGSPITLNIYGTMNFNVNGVRFKLPPGSTVYVGSGGSINKTFSGGGSSTLISVGGSNVWTAGMGSITGPQVLPIELLSFYATPKTQSILVEWSTAAEVNNDFFTIEKSRDGTAFESVATVNGAGNSSSERSYSTEDTDPWEGLSYYRLKQTDFNGFTVAFELVTVTYQLNSEFSFSIYPNPNAGEHFMMFVNAEKDSELLTVVYDIIGRPVYSRSIITRRKGENIFDFEMGTLFAPGMYTISLSSGQNTSNAKMIVK